jgi:hypothetical protein
VNYNPNVNRALQMTGSQYRVPEYRHPGEVNQERGMKLVGALANAYTGNFAGAAQGLKGAQEQSGNAFTQEQSGQQAQAASKGFDAMGLFGKLFGGFGG